MSNQLDLGFSNIPVEEVAYLAGFFDGEGSICIVNNKTKHYGLLVRVHNTKLEPLERFKLAFGGKIFLDEKGNSAYRRKPVYRWAIGSTGALLTLKTIMPFLCVKKERALIAIKFQELAGLGAINRREALVNEFYKYVEKPHGVYDEVS